MYLKLSNTPATSKMIKMVKTNLDYSNTSGLDCIPLAVLKNCKHEFPNISTDLFDMCLKGSYFSDWRVSSRLSVFDHVRMGVPG